MGSSSLTRDWTLGPLHWECGVLTTGPPGKSWKLWWYIFPSVGLLHFLFSSSLPTCACKLEVSSQVSVHSHITTYVHIMHRHVHMYHWRVFSIIVYMTKMRCYRGSSAFCSFPLVVCESLGLTLIHSLCRPRSSPGWAVPSCSQSFSSEGHWGCVFVKVSAVVATRKLGNYSDLFTSWCCPSAVWLHRPGMVVPEQGPRHWVVLQRGRERRGIVQGALQPHITSSLQSTS